MNNIKKTLHLDRLLLSSENWLFPIMIEISEKNAMDSAHRECLMCHTKNRGLKLLKTRISAPHRGILIPVSTQIGKNLKTEPHRTRKLSHLLKKN